MLCSARQYAVIYQAQGPYEEIFVPIFKAYGPNELRPTRLERHNKYFSNGTSSSLMRALLYTNLNKPV